MSRKLQAQSELANRRAARVDRRKVANGDVVPVQVDVIRSGGGSALPTGVVLLVTVGSITGKCLIDCLIFA